MKRSFPLKCLVALLLLVPQQRIIIHPPLDLEVHWDSPNRIDISYVVDDPQAIARIARFPHSEPVSDLPHPYTGYWGGRVRIVVPRSPTFTPEAGDWYKVSVSYSDGTQSSQMAPLEGKLFMPVLQR